jgi:hypothetical protein
MRGLCDGAARMLIAMPAATPSLRLLADQTVRVLAGMSDMLGGLALLVADPARPGFRPGRFRLSRARLVASTRQRLRVRHHRRGRGLLGRDGIMLAMGFGLIVPKMIIELFLRNLSSVSPRKRNA